ncbi:hypothetical protein V8C86DRAFT_2769224 [Haematococcus lacustris]
MTSLMTSALISSPSAPFPTSSRSRLKLGAGLAATQSAALAAGSSPSSLAAVLAGAVQVQRGNRPAWADRAQAAVNAQSRGSSSTVVVVTYTFKAGMRRFKLQDRFKVKAGVITRLRRLRV